MLYADQALIDDRHARIRRAMEAAGYHALVVIGDSTGNRSFIRYLADWRMFGGTAYIVFPLEGAPALIMGLGAQAEFAQELSAIRDTRPVLDRNGALIDALKEKGLTHRRLGAVGWHHVMAHGDAEAVMAGLPGVVFGDATALMRSVMAALSDEEVSQAEETHGYLTLIWNRLARELKPGRSSREVMAEAIHEAARLGCHDGMAHIGFGQASKTMPGSERIISEDDICKIFLEYSGPSGFEVELGGQFSFREPPIEYARKHRTVLEAIETAMELSRPGAVAGDLCRAIQQVFEDDGWNITGRRLWDFHGQGLGGSMPPTGLPESDEVLQPNWMINIHPGLLTEDGIGLADTFNYIVTPGGGRPLANHKPKWWVLEP
jgi:Xaa-Pro aminopeptidase